MTPEESRWMLEVLQVVFGSREEFKKNLARVIRLMPGFSAYYRS